MLDVDEGPVRFAIEEATVLASKGVTVDAGARELLRFVSRRRQVLERAAEQLRESPDVNADGGTRERAEQLLQRALAIGLFY